VPGVLFFLKTISAASKYGICNTLVSCATLQISLKADVCFKFSFAQDLNKTILVTVQTRKLIQDTGALKSSRNASLQSALSDEISDMIEGLRCA
jgi:hypothetical protein